MVYHGAESGGDALVVGHAHRVGAFGNAHNGFGQLYFLFLDNLVIFDYVHRGVGRGQRNAAKLGIFEKPVGYLDDALAPQGLALQVGAYGDGVGRMRKVQDVYDLEDALGGDMVQHGAVFDGTHFKLGLFF